MDAAMIRRIRENPSFRELDKKRGRLSWTLTILMLLIYFSYIFMVGFTPEFISQPILNDSVISLALPLGVGVILSAIILTGIYVWQANSKFDLLTRLIAEEFE